MRTRKQPWNRPLGLLVYNQESYVSAKLLAKLLDLKPIKNDFTITHLSKSFPIKIRYGNSHCRQNKDTKYNSVNTILLCSNSLEFSSFCQKNDIISPIYTPFSSGKLIQEFPILVRKKYHRAGKDIIIIRSKEELIKSVNKKFYERYWVPFIETEYEIRLHYILGNTEKIFLKQPTTNTNLEFPIRSSAFGWHYNLQANNDENRYKQAKELAKEVATKIGLSFGAFDMAWSKKLKKYIIWEINTAPGLNENTAQIYADRLTKIL